jgi:hypothetical protein
MKSKAINLNVGNVVGSGEKIVKIEVSQFSRKKEVTVILEKNGKYRTAWWGANTMISHD